MRSNTIHMGDLSFVNDKEDNTILSTYKNVVYGCGVKFKPKHYEELNCIRRYDPINLHQMTRNYTSITANKIDFIENYDDVIAVPVSYRQSSIDKGKERARKGKSKDDHGSGIVLLFLCVLPNSNKSEPSETHWNDEAATKLKFSKNNILKSSKAKHFDSLGEYYSFGNKRNFGMVDNSSVGIIPQKLTRM